MGVRIPGFHVEQACATGLQAVLVAAAEIEGGANDVVGVLTFDRTSDSPGGGVSRSAGRTNGPRPWATCGTTSASTPPPAKAMIATAGLAARKYGIDRREVDEITLCRYEQYFEAKDSGFLDRVLVPLEVLNLQGRPMGTVDDDLGVRRVSAGDLRAMRELDTCITAGSQTHASDGMACLLVTSSETARELSPRPEIEICLVAKAEVRTSPSLMPEAPALAVAKLLEATGLGMEDMAVVKNHNPFRGQRCHLQQGGRPRLAEDEHNRLLAGVGAPAGSDPDQVPHRGSGGSRSPWAAATSCSSAAPPAMSVSPRSSRSRIRKGVGCHDHAMRPSTLETLGLGSVLDLIRKGRLPVSAGELVDRVFGAAPHRGCICRVRRQRHCRCGQDHAARVAARARSGCLSWRSIFPGCRTASVPSTPGLVRAFGADRAAAIMGNVIRLAYDGSHLPSQLDALSPRFLLEAVPEDLEIKRAHYEVFRAAFPEIEIRSVTSGFPQSELGVGSPTRPSRTRSTRYSRSSSRNRPRSRSCCGPSA